MIPGPLTSSVEVPPVVTSWFTQVMLVRAQAYLHYGRVAQRRPMPSNSGTTAAFRRLNALALQTTPLVEGVVGTGKQLSKTDVTAILRQYGDFITLTDYFELTVENAVLADASRVLGEQSGKSIDAILRDTYVAGTSVFYGAAASARTDLLGVSHKVDVPLLRRLERQLRQQDARPFTRIVDANDGVGTRPVREAYWCITTPGVHFTLNTLSGWHPVAEYAATEGALPGEVGAFEGLRFLVSSQAKSFAGAGGTASGDVKYTVVSAVNKADVHTILCFGQDAVGIVPLDGNSFENIIHPRTSGGPSNPFNQYGTMAWKRNGTQLILNDNFMTRAEVTVADVTP